ncbi:PfkB family carbohydrate kinase [Streptomyces sp. NBC_01255]|uniref:PfkB family carbohydrate kinase n=1 Tax=Streptomyces sp. NBC_01255 TaxID=2903798 RepID=UPI002E37451A|nr:PfkB family carbohydrate kinase [Streptomyces sp. NBC_01255]
MVTFLPSRPGRLADVPSFARAIGGAESNVACTLAAAGHRVKWVGRVGRDGFGDHLVDTIGGYGVDVTAVTRDPHRPTGVYFRTDEDRATDAHEVVYYRAGSAASAMSPATVPYDSVADARVLHLTGITAALSAGCLALMRELTAPRPGRPLVSFDVNHRPGLWSDGTAPEVLLELARRADLVFVGADEAEALWGLRDPAAIRGALPEPAVLVVKRGGEGAVVFERCAASSPTPPLPETGVKPPDPVRPAVVPSNAGRAEIQPRRRLRRGVWGGAPVREGAGWGEAPRSGPAPEPSAPATPTPDTVTSVPAPRVDVVAPVGAGDAFAAGFLSATLRGLDMDTRLRHGHLMAAAALTVPGDVAVPPRRAHADRLAALDAGAWGTLHLGPGWTGDDQEVRTP